MRSPPKPIIRFPHKGASEKNKNITRTNANISEEDLRKSYTENRQGGDDLRFPQNPPHALQKSKGAPESAEDDSDEGFKYQSSTSNAKKDNSLGGKSYTLVTQ